MQSASCLQQHMVLNTRVDSVCFPFSKTPVQKTKTKIPCMCGLGLSQQMSPHDHGEAFVNVLNATGMNTWL